ncbi:hypothetical protein GCM10027053_15320 [Intrasporangium mesophilum]
MPRMAALVVGVLLVLVALPLLGAGGTALWADRTQRDAGYVTADVHEFSSAGAALTTVPTDLGSAGTGWLYSPALLDTVRIRVTPTNPDSKLFVGIGPSAEVDRYLAGVQHTVMSDFWTSKTHSVGGSTTPAAPATRGFWVAASTGAGARSLVWGATEGSWKVVVMNTDARPGIDVVADLGARLPAVVWIAAGLLVAGTVIAVGGVLLVVGALRRRVRTR